MTLFRSYPDDVELFDPIAGDIADRDELLSLSYELPLYFPFEYTICKGLGTTKHRRWRVIAWIARSRDIEKPLSGEWYGTTLYNIGKCGGFWGDYCAVTDNVDFYIDTEAK